MAKSAPPQHAQTAATPGKGSTGGGAPEDKSEYGIPLQQVIKTANLLL
ncbi:hypothetical protein [Candidatus Palauibacter sp.]